MILAAIAVVSVLINAYFFLRPEPEPEFDKMTSITLRLAEQKYLSEEEKLFIVHKEFMDLDFEDIDTEMIEIFQHNVNEKVRSFKARIFPN